MKKKVIIIGKDINIGDKLTFEYENKEVSGFLKYVTEKSITLNINGVDMDFNRTTFYEVELKDIEYTKK